jgi:hypothetical protein
MATKPDLDSISISKASNGGYTVQHKYKPRPSYKRGPTGGFNTEYNAPEEHVFSKDEGHKVIAHVSKALGMPQAKEDVAEVKD